MQEVWKKTFESDSYEVSSLGRVRSVDRVVKQTNQAGEYTRIMRGRLLKPQPNGRGYVFVWVHGKQITVHKLVATAFIENPNQLPQVNHKDGDKTNNAADNLEWVDNSGNQQHALATGLMRKALGEAVGVSKLTNEAVLHILRSPNVPTRTLAEQYNVNMQTIRDIRNRKTWKHIQP